MLTPRSRRFLEAPLATVAPPTLEGRVSTKREKVQLVLSRVVRVYLSFRVMSLGFTSIMFIIMTIMIMMVILKALLKWSKTLVARMSEF